MVGKRLCEIFVIFRSASLAMNSVLTTVASNYTRYLLLKQAHIPSFSPD